jgi:protein-S-isoprenylcysteine O-methyltransferase Ste14
MNAQTKIEVLLRPDPRPRSAVSHGVGIVGLIGLGVWVAVARGYGMEGPLAALCALLACGVPMVAWSLLVDRVHRNPSTGIDWSMRRPWREVTDISLAKITGLWAIWTAIACLYCIGRWYWDGNYLFAMQVLGIAALPLLFLSVPYVLWLDRRLKEPRDAAWHFGRLIIGRSRGVVDLEIVHDFLRSWAVKGFFLAFMLSIVPGNWADVIRAPAPEIAANPVQLIGWLIAIMFMVDVSFATVGYMLTCKPLDAHIRSANPYAAGWTAALICYPPFIMMNAGGPLDYHQGTAQWTHWLQDYPLGTVLMGIVLVALTAVYAWATVAFGIRFSNLTHRGILTHGPYAWTKHPAYVSKNIFWWLATLPFFATTGNPVDMVRNTAVLAMVTGIYYWRARTEERHLMADPAYREYAEWMERNGLLPRLVAKLRRTMSQPLPAE